MTRSKKNAPAKNAPAKAEVKKVSSSPKATKVTASFGKLAENRVTAKRLSRFSDADRKKALAAFEKGTPIAEIAKTYGLKISNARYSLLSERVRSGKVAPLSATDVRALKASVREEGAAVTATRAGISGTKLRELTK